MCHIKIQLPQRHFSFRLKDSAFSYLIGFENLSKPQINNCHGVFLNSQFLDSYTCKDCKLFERARLDGERGWTGCGCLVKTLQIIYYYFSDFFLLLNLFNPNSPSPREKQGNRWRNTELRKQFEKKKSLWLNKVRLISRCIWNPKGSKLTPYRPGPQRAAGLWVLGELLCYLYSVF